MISLDFVPVLRPDTVRSPIDGHLLVWPSIAGSPTLLDPVQSVLLDMVDGVATVDDLATDVHEEVGLDIDAARSRVSDLIASFGAAGLLTASVSEVTASEAIASRELFANPCLSCMSNAVQGMTSLGLRFGDRTVGLASDSRRALAKLRHALDDYIVDASPEAAPVGFVLTAPAGFQRHHHLADRSGFVHSTGRGLASGLHAVGSHLTALLPTAPGVVRVRASAIVSDRGHSAVCLFPLLLVPPATDAELTAAGWARVDRVALDIEVATGRVVNPPIPWPDLAALSPGPGHVGTGSPMVADAVISVVPPGGRPATRAEVVSMLAGGALSGSPSEVLHALVRMTEGTRLESVTPETNAFVSLIAKLADDLR